jgi:hypothetical protein
MHALLDDTVKVKGKVTAVLENVFTGEKRVFETENLVTTAGDLYYAQRSANETPTNFTSGATFDGIMELYESDSGAVAEGNDRSDLGTIVGSGKAMDGTYPKTNDGDSDNTGSGTTVVTYLVSFTTGEVNGDIADVIITNPSPGASEPILMHAEFGAAFTKTSSDTLKVFVNHTLAGAGS